MPNTDQSYLNQIWGYATASRSWRTCNILGKRLEYALVQGAESKVSYNLTQFHFGTRDAFISVNPPHSPTGTETHCWKLDQRRNRWLEMQRGEHH
jgi:hypothetical protein